MAVVWTPELLMDQLLEDLEETESGDDVTTITFKAHCLARDTAILLQQQLSSIRAGEAPVKKKKGPLRRISKMASKVIKMTSQPSPKGGNLNTYEEEEEAEAYDDPPTPMHKTTRANSNPIPKSRPPPVSKQTKSQSASTPRGNKIGNMGKRLLTSALPSKSVRSGNSQAKTGNKLRVLIRKRPAKSTEEDKVECKGNQVFLHENMVKVDLTKYVKTHKFCYDDAFGDEDTTGDLYHGDIQELVDNFFNEGTSTCFCFGQTASGKTFTLFGEGGGQVMSDEDTNQSSEKGGVYMLAAEDIFGRLEQDSSLCLSVSMFEIYGQKVKDLFDNGKELAALEDGDGVLQLVGLKGLECSTMDEFVNASNVGRLARSTTATGANATSSRSHAAMLFRLVSSAPNKDPSKPKKVLGKFSLIDLAGSERGKDNEATDKKTQMEGRQINQSLLALKEVIRAKELGRKHAPYRQSRLTQVLEESLTGSKCHTTVIGCVSPSAPDSQQTLNTLRYAESLAGKKRAPRAASVRGATSPLNREESVEEDFGEANGGGGGGKNHIPAPNLVSKSSAPNLVSKSSSLKGSTSPSPARGGGRAGRGRAATVVSRRTSAPSIYATDEDRPPSPIPVVKKKGASHRMSMPPQYMESDSLSNHHHHGHSSSHSKSPVGSRSAPSSRVSAMRTFSDVYDVNEEEDLELMTNILTTAEGDGEDDIDILNTSELYDILEETGLEEFHDLLRNAMLGSSSFNALKSLGLDGAIKAGVPKIKAMKLWRAVMLA